MRRILVTGAEGFIGRQACAALAARGFEVRGVGRADLDLLSDDPAPLLRDVRPSHLLHLAWTATPGKFWADPANTAWHEASVRLFRAFAAAGGRRFIGAGTCAEYDWSHPLLDEASTPLAPRTLYGQMKAKTFGDLSVLAAETGVSFAWGRVFFLYGPGEKPGRVVSDLIAALRAGRPFETSEGLQRRDFMHVADVGAAFAALADSEAQGAVNIASGQAVPVRQVVETVARLLGREDLVRFGARPAQIGEPPVMEAAVQRLRDEVGFTPRFGLGDVLTPPSPWRGEGPGMGVG